MDKLDLRKELKYLYQPSAKAPVIADVPPMRFLAIEEHPDAAPPYAQSVYLFQRGARSYQAVIRLVLAKGRFYQMTFAGTEEDFELLYPSVVASFDSLRIGKP